MSQLIEVAIDPVKVNLLGLSREKMIEFFLSPLLRYASESARER